MQILQHCLYALVCKEENCRKVYIGDSKRLLKARIDDHHGYVVNNKLTKARGEHLNLPGHSLADLSQRCKNVRTCKQCSCKMLPSSGKI